MPDHAIDQAGLVVRMSPEEYARWEGEQIAEGERIAADPDTVWISNDSVMTMLDEMRAKWSAEDKLSRDAA
jgi:hypothetical protein